MITLVERCRRLLSDRFLRPRPEDLRKESSAVVVPLGTAIRHNASTIVGTVPLDIVTPAQRWAYAAEFPLPKAAIFDGPMVVCIEARLINGSVGAGCLDREGNLVAEVFLSNTGGIETKHIVLPTGGNLQSLVLRNVADSASPSRILINQITLSRASEAELKGQELLVNADSLRQFKPWSGVTPAGFWTDWLGERTRTEVWEFKPEFAAVYGAERFESPGIPVNNDDILNWMPMMDAVVASGDTFVMVALGAGWGRWLVSGAFAAMQSGRRYRLVGVEAEPTHFGWMVRHFEENGLDPECYTLVRAAIAAEEGECWFRVGNSAAWYGQSIASDLEIDAKITARADIWSEVSIGEERLQRVRAVDLAAIARDLPIIDYLHMDVQGAEADVLCPHPDVLKDRVRMVNIGTHSPEIEERLRNLFSGLHWRSVYEVPLKSTLMVRLGDAEARRIEFGDGVQVWTNPALFKSASTEHSP